MLTFLSLLAPAFVAAMLLTTGVGHLRSFAEFAALVRGHRVLPARAAGVVAGGVVAVELLVGAGAVALVAGAVPPGMGVALTGLSGIVGLAFLAYVDRLLRRPGAAGGCGCSPMAAPLTRLSRVPAAALAAVAALSLLAAAIRPGGDGLGIASLPAHAVAMAALPLVWGVTLAGVVLLVPAAAGEPEPAASRTGAGP
jgi:hypothetical protein